MPYFDAVLFSPPSRMINHYRPPVSLLYVGGYLRHKGLSVKIIDVPLKEQIRDKHFLANIDNIIENVREKMLNSFKDLKTKIVGISCYTSEYAEVVRLAQDIKKIDNSVKIIAGGIHPTLYPQDFFDEDTGVDIAVIGEGELIMYELCKSILAHDKKDLSEIKGIAYIDDKAKKMISTPIMPLADDLDNISFPDYSLIDMEYYTNANPYAIRGCFLRSTYLLASRGCPSQCTFCVAKKLREFSGCGKMRSAESLISELRELKEKYSIDSFYFIDDLFTINKDNVRRFCNLLKTEKINLVWGCSSTIPILDEETIRSMAEANCIQIDFGVERGSDRALRIIKKGQNINTVKNIFSLCHKYGIRTFANMLVNLPEETEEDLEDIIKLLDVISPEIVTLNIFTPYPGTEIYEKSNYRFKKTEYAYLAKDPIWLVKTYSDKFKYPLHNIDLSNWTRHYSRHYNKVFPTLKFHLAKKYLWLLFRSEAKINYIRQFSLLIREFIIQKF